LNIPRHRYHFFGGVNGGILRTSTQGYLCEDLKLLVHQLVRCNPQRLVKLYEMARRVVEGKIGFVDGLQETQV
jgi:hypothetical protein